MVLGVLESSFHALSDGTLVALLISFVMEKSLLPWRLLKMELLKIFCWSLRDASKERLQTLFCTFSLGVWYGISFQLSIVGVYLCIKGVDNLPMAMGEGHEISWAKVLVCQSTLSFNLLGFGPRMSTMLS